MNILLSRPCKEYYQKHKEEIDKSNKIYYQKHRTECLKNGRLRYEKNTENIKKYTSEWRKMRQQSRKLWKSDDKILYAQGTARYYIKLKPYCEICGTSENRGRHHWNYEKPLMVSTLCKECHDIQHVKKFNESRFAGGNVLSH